MPRDRRRVATTSWLQCLALLASIAAGCATYQARPVDPAAQLPLYYSRHLDDAGLGRWLDSIAAPPPGSVRRLALAAEYFRPERRRWQAEWDAAQAGMITAGARPEPGAGVDLEYAFSDPQASSRWVVGLSGVFTLEFGGKRGARVAGAEARRLLTRSRIDEERWAQAQRVYHAALGARLAARRKSAVALELEALDTVAQAARARFDEGTLGRLDLARLDSERRGAVAELALVSRKLAAAESDLAAAIGVPVAELERLSPEWPPGGGCALADTADAAALGREALGARPSIWRAAAAYLVAEAELRGEVARASPDLELGPGLLLDQGTGKLTLGGLLPSIPFNRNRGPIAEAEARRAAAGGSLAEVQDRVLAELESALARCRATRGSVSAADSLAAAAADRLELAEAAWQRGELGRLDLAQARLELLRSRRFRAEVEGEVEAAGLELERSLGAWGRRADGPWPAAGPADTTRRDR